MTLRVLLQWTLRVLLQWTLRVLLQWTLRVLLELQILQPTVCDQPLILLKTVRVSVTVVRELKVLIHLGTIFGVLVANEVVSLNVSDIWAVGEEFGIFCKWIVSLQPIK